MDYFEFSYAIRFSVQLFLCESPLLIYQNRRQFFWLRLVFGLLAYFGLIYGLYCLFKLIPGFQPWASMLYFFLCFLINLGMIEIAFKLRIAELLFVGTSGYSVQHMVYSLLTIALFYWPSTLPRWAREILLNGLPYLTAAILFYFCLVRPSYRKGELHRRDSRSAIISAIILIYTLVLSVWSSGDYTAPSFLSSVVSRIYAIGNCLVALLLQFEIFHSDRLVSDKQIVDQLLHEERKQQSLSKQTVDIINLKCHDMKHQLSALESLQNSAQAKQSLQEIQHDIMVYDANVKTGNDALDVVVMEKGLLCEHEGIRLNCLLDGSLLSFMEDNDIFSLFGNILDNAIECEEKEEKEKRYITLKIEKIGEMVWVHEDNYCSSPVVFTDEGMPLTTKADTNYHGFGTKSIRFIGDKYGGKTTLQRKGNLFTVDLLITPKVG